MNNYEITINGTNYTRISKIKARNLWNYGIKIYMQSNNANLQNNFNQLVEMPKVGSQETYKSIGEYYNFDDIINNFMIYVPKELGTYAIYLIKTELLKHIKNGTVKNDIGQYVKY